MKWSEQLNTPKTVQIIYPPKWDSANVLTIRQEMSSTGWKEDSKRILTQLSKQRSGEQTEIEKPWRHDSNRSFHVCWMANVPRFELKIWFLLEKPCFHIKYSFKTPFFSRAYGPQNRINNWLHRHRQKASVRGHAGRVLNKISGDSLLQQQVVCARNPDPCSTSTPAVGL
jgi:hypothetical protein